MATSYLSARPDQTAAQALASIRQAKDGGKQANPFILPMRTTG